MQIFSICSILPAGSHSLSDLFWEEPSLFIYFETGIWFLMKRDEFLSDFFKSSLFVKMNQKSKIKQNIWRALPMLFSNWAQSDFRLAILMEMMRKHSRIKTSCRKQFVSSFYIHKKVNKSSQWRGSLRVPPVLLVDNLLVNSVLILWNILSCLGVAVCEDTPEFPNTFQKPQITSLPILWFL